ncbi:NUDIX hydrolase [Curvivirga aplysinae]|uniref:NUDIX hydrolase n=1 Tax=Curvivirga aplysinae TaxID=2529852 RepID=UPI001C3F80F4|nr:NUDIX hydrolase [Curvivirga aplysinae]
MKIEKISKPSIGIGVVLLWENNVLLIQRDTPPKQGTWSIPGGKQEFGETMKQAATREVKEETGLIIQEEKLKLLDVADMIQLPHFHYSLIDFYVTEFSGELKAGSDAKDARWVPLDDLSDYQIWAETARVIRMAIEKSSQ